VHIISRAVKPGKTAVVNGYEIAANTEVVFAPFAVHRNPALWEDPLAFRPDRFRDQPQPFTFMPFGVGERTCMGRSYARMCVRVMLTVLLSEFDLSIDTSRPLVYKSGPLVIVPKHPLTGRITIA
jgi:cytochrome P450